MVRVVIAGHVDHGKSTLVGRLLSDTGQIHAERFEKVQRICEKSGKNFEYAFLLDAFEEEQFQGITIDMTEILWKHAGREFLLIDTPGHKELLKNMMSGASRADAAVLLLDATEGVRDQFLRHSSILALLGIKDVILVINKMDRVGYAIEEFNTLRKKATETLAGFGISPLRIIPVSALNGENLVSTSAKMPWYQAPTLVEALSELSARKARVEQPLRFPVQAVYKFDERRIVAGRIESGRLRVGDRLRFLPSGEETTVKSIEAWNATAPAEVAAGQSVGITLADPLFLDRGAVATHPEEPQPQIASRLRANLFWLGKEPLKAGKKYKIKLASQEAQCEVLEVLGERREIPKGEGGQIVLSLATPLVFDEFSRVESLGRFVLVEDHEVSGGGIVDRNLLGGERRSGGFAIWLTGLSGSGKSTAAAELKKTLSRKGLNAAILDGDQLRQGLCSDLGFSMEDRAENIRRAAEVAKILCDAGVVAISALISPLDTERAKAKQIIGADRFIEVFIDCPLEECEKRDPKGLYKKVRAGLIQNFTGIDSPYEPPRTPEIRVQTHLTDLGGTIAAIVAKLSERGWIPRA